MEVVGIAEPTVVNGYVQRPIEGTSFAYTFDSANAKAPSRRTQQYFEMLGNRGMYANGWIACCRHGRLPWETGRRGSDFEHDKWELYRIEEDFSQAVDLAEKSQRNCASCKISSWRTRPSTTCFRSTTGSLNGST